MPITVRQAIEDYLFAIKHLSPKTQKEYRGKLFFFATWCESQPDRPGIAEVKRPVLRRFFNYLATEHVHHATGKPISTYTQHGYARVIKAFLTWCANEEDLEGLVSDNVPRKMEMPRVAQIIKEVYTKQQIAALLKAAEKEYNEELAVRDKAIIAVLLSTGIRGGELVGLTLENCFLTPEDSYIRIFGKGMKWRDVPLDDAVQPLRRYINRFRKRIADPHVFLNRYSKPLGLYGLDQVISRLATWSRDLGGSDLKACYPHKFRHTYAVRYLLHGGDIYHLRLRMGHSSVKVTEEYLKALEGILARGAQQLYI
jgi:site-specific recombinase XerD